VPERPRQDRYGQPFACPLLSQNVAGGNQPSDASQASWLVLIYT